MTKAKKRPTQKAKVKKKTAKKPSVKKVVKQIEKEIIPTEAELGFDDVELEDEIGSELEEYYEDVTDGMGQDDN